jgi:hypothetical protein
MQSNKTVYTKSLQDLLDENNEIIEFLNTYIDININDEIMIKQEFKNKNSKVKYKNGSNGVHSHTMDLISMNVIKNQFLRERLLNAIKQNGKMYFEIKKKEIYNFLSILEQQQSLYNSNIKNKSRVDSTRYLFYGYRNSSLHTKKIIEYNALRKSSKKIDEIKKKITKYILTYRDVCFILRREELKEREIKEGELREELHENEKKINDLILLLNTKNKEKNSEEINNIRLSLLKYDSKYELKKFNLKKQKKNNNVNDYKRTKLYSNRIIEYDTKIKSTIKKLKNLIKNNNNNNNNG